eukprot:12309050-Alexandrium_andersonii.AAC.1
MRARAHDPLTHKRCRSLFVRRARPCDPLAPFSSGMPEEPRRIECRRCRWLVPRVVQEAGPTQGFCEA